MTSLVWIQRDQSVTKIVCHSASRQNVPQLRDCQNVSSKIAERGPTPAACHTTWAKGQAKNRCEQSSTAPAHSGHSTGESGAMRYRRNLVIRRRLRRSQANTLIFTGRGRFHTNRHCCKRSRSFESFWSCNRRYAAWELKLGPLHTHASWATSGGLLASSSCRLRCSTSHWSNKAVGKSGTQASCQARRTKAPRPMDNA